MKEFTYIIKDQAGFHARPVGAIVKVAKASNSNITISYGEKSADAKKLFEVMGLAVKQNEEIRVSILGDDEEKTAELMLNTLEMYA